MMYDRAGGQLCCEHAGSAVQANLEAYRCASPEYKSGPGHLHTQSSSLLSSPVLGIYRHT